MFLSTPDQLSLLAVLAAPVLLAIIIYFTRPGLRRLLGALAGGLVFIVLNTAWDIAAHYAGWWHFPFTTDTHAPLLFYVVQDLPWGVGGTLIGWRITRRFGIRGLLIFLVLLSVLGSMRDFANAASAHLIVFGTGIVPVLADWSCWATLFLLAQLTLRVIAGPASADQLASWSLHLGKPAK